MKNSGSQKIYGLPSAFEAAKLLDYKLYQLNLDVQEGRVYQEYWDKYPNHFIEEI